MQLNKQQSIHDKWNEELKSTADRYHRIVIWVAIIFNILFAITDYINVQEHWKTFLVVRIASSTITFLAMVLRKKLNLTSAQVVFVPFILISIQNAFMWSQMDAVHLQKHTLAYMALFIGAGMLILWTIRYSIIIVVLSIIANIGFFLYYSELGVEEIMVNGGLLTASVAIFSILLIQTRYNLTKKEIIARTELEASNLKLNAQKEIIEENNRHITDSIKYAKRIQDAILPNDDLLKIHLKEHFVYFEPKDIVSGDFYWYSRRESTNTTFIAAVDCTGHGVPGAFMSMIGNTLLNEIVLDESIETPAEMLFALRSAIIEALLQSGQGDSKEGMDIALCMIQHDEQKMQYAGAYNSLFMMRDGELTTMKADRMPIGTYHDRNEVPFTNHEIALQDGDSFYIFSDGYVDQFGGVDEKKFSTRNFKKLVTKMSTLPMRKQELALKQTMDKWKKGYDQLDDMLVIGFRI
ncbi:MAG: SpoIIE family protein phosphatase [Cyclobacteriaceae bacterium]